MVKRTFINDPEGGSFEVDLGTVPVLYPRHGIPTRPRSSSRVGQDEGSSGDKRMQ